MTPKKGKNRRKVSQHVPKTRNLTTPDTEPFEKSSEFIHHFSAFSTERLFKYNDALHKVIACRANVDGILTRNIKDFECFDDIAVWRPDDI